jgi:N-glycosylase/DNA lyase
MAKLREKYVSVDQLAQAFRISERAVQRLAIYEGMPRKSRGEYPWFECLSWFVAHLQKKLCRNCDELVHTGPCRGMESAARADRHRALEKIARLAPRLVGLDAESIRQNLTEAIDEVCSAVD